MGSTDQQEDANDCFLRDVAPKTSDAYLQENVGIDLPRSWYNDLLRINQVAQQSS